MITQFGKTTATEKIRNLKKRIRIIQGGTAAGKTLGIIGYLIHEAQKDETPTLTSIVSESFPHLKKGAIRDFLFILESTQRFNPDLWNKTDYVYTFETGSKIEFFSVDQAGKVRGPRRNRLFINEANNVSFETFEQLEVRTKEFIIIDYNPVAEFWAQEIKDNDFLILTYKDNEALEQSIIDSIESRKGRKDWWTVYGLGQLGEIQGLIYSNWRIIDEVPFEARLERRWLDFGYTNDESAIGNVYYYNGGWILDEELYRKGMSNKQLADFLNSLDRPQTTIIADSAEPKSIDELKGYGLNVVPCAKGKDSVRTGIQLVQDQPISVTKRSVNIIKEQRNYLWMIDKNGKILNEEDPACKNHHMSGIRYAISTLGRLKQEVNYWDKVFEDELNPKKKQFNKGR